MRPAPRLRKESLPAVVWLCFAPRKRSAASMMRIRTYRQVSTSCSRPWKRRSARSRKILESRARSWSARSWTNKSETYGFDAQDEKYVDMIEAGIVDPAKVVRTALQDAASVAGLLVTTEAMVAELPKEPVPAMPPGGTSGEMGF